MAQAPRRADAETSRFVAWSRIASWASLGLVVMGSLWSSPELARAPIFVAVLVAQVIVLLLVGRTRLVTANARARLLYEFALGIVGSTALILIAGAAARALMFVFLLPVGLAPIAIGIRSGRIVLGVAVGAVLVIALSAWPQAGRSVLVDAATAVLVFVCAYHFLKQLVRGLATLQQRAVAATERDHLTGALSFSAFLYRGQIFHERARAARTPYGVLIIDIDELKSINERYGYGAGSRAIELVATAVERLRHVDELLARYDGDKLVVLVPRLDGTRIVDLAQRIRNAVFSTTLNVETQVVRIKANVGVARFPVDATTLDMLLVAAEADMRVDRAGREPPKTKPVFKRRSGTKSG